MIFECPSCYALVEVEWDRARVGVRLKRHLRALPKSFICPFCHVGLPAGTLRLPITAQPRDDDEYDDYLRTAVDR